MAARGDMELSLRTILGLMLRTLAHDANVELGTILTAAIVIPGPFVTNLASQ